MEPRPSRPSAAPRVSGPLRATGPQTIRPRRRKGIELVVLVALLGVWLAVRSWNAAESVLPQEVIGTWTTTAPGYGDRKIEFQPTHVRFFTGPATSSTYEVRRVRSTSRAGVTAYTVDYAGADGTVTLSFRYVSGRRPAIRLAHESFVWWRERR